MSSEFLNTAKTVVPDEKDSASTFTEKELSFLIPLNLRISFVGRINV
ncbi:MAG: hypothetical protein IPM96_10400 [Ignavibacteria bacterium]|nr:hypothetical protein [Ignavibacteria bacterium]